MTFHLDDIYVFQRIEPVSQRNGRHVKRKAGWSPLNPYSSVKREFSEDLLTSSFMDCDAENAAGPSQLAATSDMDCDGDNIPYDQRRGQVKIEPGYTSQLVTQSPWSRVGNSSQGPSLFPKSEFESSESKLWSKSNAPIHFQVGEEQREDIGSDDDYEAIHSGLDIHDESRVSPISYIMVLHYLSSLETLGTIVAAPTEEPCTR